MQSKQDQSYAIPFIQTTQEAKKARTQEAIKPCLLNMFSINHVIYIHHKGNPQHYFLRLSFLFRFQTNTLPCSPNGHQGKKRWRIRTPKQPTHF